MPRELLDFAKHAHDACGVAATKLCFDQRFDRDGALMCSYATLIEYTGGMIALAEAKKLTSSMAVLRSMLEAFVDFTNLLKDRSYFKTMLVNSNDARLQMLERASQGKNEFLAGIHQLDDFQARLAERKDDARRFGASGAEALRIRDRFRRAGMEDVYDSVYAHLSVGAHNDLVALRKRHALTHEGGYKLHIYRPVELEEFYMELDSAVSYLLRASVMIHEQLKSDESKQIDTLIEEFRGVRTAYSD